MLRTFDLLARKYNMPYWIRSGTLIGAARHNGFIPWGDDIDIAIPMMYYVDFFRILNKDLPYEMFFQTSVTDEYYDDLPGNKTALSDKTIYCALPSCWFPSIFPLREMTFEGFNVLVPSNWESLVSVENPHFWELPRYDGQNAQK